MLACLMAALLTACATGGAVTKEFCAIARPILISKADSLTDGTARQILNHNEIGARLCGW